MSLFPKIAQTCPWLDRLDEAMDGDFCRMCQRNVYDLTGMTDPERVTFLAACGGDACVRYTAYVRPAVAAALVAASSAVLVPAASAQRHELTPAEVRPLRQPYVPVLLGGVPPPIDVPAVVVEEPPVPPVEPAKPVQPSVVPDRGPQTRRD